MYVEHGLLSEVDHTYMGNYPIVPMAEALKRRKMNKSINQSINLDINKYVLEGSRSQTQDLAFCADPTLEMCLQGAT